MTTTVLHVIPSFAGGGAERQLVWLSRALVDAGVRVHIAHLHGGPNLAGALASGATLHALPVSGNYDPSVLGKTAALIRRVGADVVQTWLLHADVTGGLAARRVGVPWLLSERQSAGFYAGGAKFYLRRLLGRRADMIVANSEAGARYWRDAGYTGALQVIRNIVPDATAPGPPVVPPSREPALVVVVGRLSEEKNYPTLLTALESALARVPAARVDVLGEGHLRPVLQARIDASSVLAGRVRLVGHVDDVADRLARAAAFVSLSRFEGTPNAVLDAMRAGCPMVLSDIDTHRELADDRSALFTPLADPGRCADALVTTLGDVAASGQRATRARQRLLGEDWSAPRIASRYAALYESLRARATA